MRLTTRLIVFGYPLVEFLLVWLIASVIGWGWALIGIVLGVPVGMAIIRNASAGARVALQETEPERAARFVPLSHSPPPAVRFATCAENK